MKKVLVLLVAALALAAVGFAGCGDDDDNGNGEAGGVAGAEATATEEAAPEPTQDIVALAQETPELSTLVEAVTAAELVETLQGEGPFTVFAPTNDAFAQVEGLDELLQPENREQLTSILTYHVVPGEITSADLEDGQTVETVQGETLEISIDGETVQVNDATVVTPDVEASNGVVHVIDGVLVPGS